MTNGFNGGVIYPPRSPLEEARELERRALFINTAKLGSLLIIYEILRRVLTYVYYGVVATVCSGSFNMMPWQSVEYLKAHQEIVNTTLFSMAANLSIVLVSVTILMLMARLVFKLKVFELTKPCKRSIPQAAKWFPLCMLVNILVSLIIRLIQNYLSAYGVVIPESDFSIKEPSTLAIVLQFLYVILIGPVAEELIYRGLILTALKPFGSRLAVFFSALIFAVMHGNIPQAASAFVSALVMGAVAVRCGSIIPTILIHIANNIFASYYDFSDVLGWANADEIYMAMQIVILFAGVFVLFVFGYQLLEVKDGRYALPFGKRMTAVFTNPAMLMYLLYELYCMMKLILLAN